MIEPRVSVALPTRNRWPMLEQALDSALRQDGVEVEVIVVDEASSDVTPERLPAVGDERLVVIRNDEPRGPGAARNAAIERARGEWVAFLDDDDILAPTSFRTQLAGGADGRVLSYTGRVEVDDALTVVHRSRPADPADLGHKMLSNNPLGGPSGVLVRRDVLRRVGGFDESFSALADWDLWVRVAALGPAGTAREPLLAYRRHPQNMMVTQAEQVDEEFLRLREKHAAAAKAAGVEFGADWLARWNASRALAEGRRAAAARGYARQALIHRNPRDLVRAAAALGGEPLERLGRAVERRATDRPAWLERYA
jgi:glycosyltransferase involved in cell wall biosynthesis